MTVSSTVIACLPSRLGDFFFRFAPPASHGRVPRIVPRAFVGVDSRAARSSHWCWTTYFSPHTRFAMPTDGHYSHSARLGTPSHHVAGQHHQQPRRQHARGGAAAPPQHHIASTSGASASASASGTASASASSSATPHHLLNTVLIDDAATSGLNIERITRRANVHSIDASRGHGGPRMGYAFPETYDDPDTLQQQKETYFGMLQGSVRAGRLPWDGGLNGSSGDPWGWADEGARERGPGACHITMR